MPEWMTPEFLPVWWKAKRDSFSSKTREAEVYFRRGALAVERPKTPPPIMTMSYFFSGIVLFSTKNGRKKSFLSKIFFQLYNELRFPRIGEFSTESSLLSKSFKE